RDERARKAADAVGLRAQGLLVVAEERAAHPELDLEVLLDGRHREAHLGQGDDLIDDFAYQLERALTRQIPLGRDDLLAEDRADALAADHEGPADHAAVEPGGNGTARTDALVAPAQQAPRRHDVAREHAQDRRHLARLAAE